MKSAALWMIAAIAAPGGRSIKNTPGGTGKRTVGLCLMMTTLLFGSAVAKADVVLDWNTIAVDTAVAKQQNPFA
jgi:hypothetical protein